MKLTGRDGICTYLRDKRVTKKEREGIWSSSQWMWMWEGEEEIGGCGNVGCARLAHALKSHWLSHSNQSMQEVAR